MTAQNYIQEQLEKIKKPLGLSKLDGVQLSEEIARLVLSKKFRKYAVSQEQIDYIKSAIKICITENKPIQMTFGFGGYKLWRLDEFPEVDWAELFALMYFTNWLKPICEIYKPGIWFDFFSDDVIVPILNNITVDDTRAYQKSFNKLLDFLKQYQPRNLNMTFNRVGDQYDSETKFQEDLEIQIRRLEQRLDGGLPALSATDRATLELNVRTTPEQRQDPKWREKVQLIHDGFTAVIGRRPYYRVPDKFNVITTPSDGKLSVGTTKNSIIPFWIGVGVLKRFDGFMKQTIYSPKQINDGKFDFEPINIVGLDGKNFKKIRITD